MCIQIMSSIPSLFQELSMLSFSLDFVSGDRISSTRTKPEEYIHNMHRMHRNIWRQLSSIELHIYMVATVYVHRHYCFRHNSNFILHL